MIKKLLLAIATLIATMTFALAQVEINKADVSALGSVKGIREKTAAKLSEAGLQVNGKSLDGAPMKTADAKSSKSATVKK